MTRDIDKNDVNIQDLFKWKRELEIKDPVSGESGMVYLRVIGDADLNRVRTYAFRRAAKLREKLNNPESEESIAFINEIEEFKTDPVVLINYILLLKQDEFRRQANLNVSMPLPMEPKSTATQEKKEEYQKEVDEYPKKFRDTIIKEIEKIEKKERKHLESLELDQLYDIYKAKLINRLCTEELESAYMANSIVFGTYSDNEYTKRVFETVEDFENSARPLKDILITAYQELELGIDALKKLPEATPSQASGQ